MSTYVLVHGAWHGAWCWSRLAPVLRANGHQVYTPDLPGHGVNRLDRRKITAQDYILAIQELIMAQPDPVILLGHSMGGMVISGVAERIPERIEILVYLSAFLLVNGESINDLEGKVGDSLVAPNLVMSRDRILLSIATDSVREAFYADCNEADYHYALANLQPQPILPFITPLAVSDTRYGSVPRVYIESRFDRALPLAAQRQMQAHTRCEKVFTLDAGHAAFFSRYNELAGILLQLPARPSRA